MSMPTHNADLIKTGNLDLLLLLLRFALTLRLYTDRYQILSTAEVESRTCASIIIAYRHIGTRALYLLLLLLLRIALACDMHTVGTQMLSGRRSRRGRTRRRGERVGVAANSSEEG